MLTNSSGFNAITIVANNGGYTSEIGTIVVDYASNKDIVITPDQHYHVASIKLDGVEILGELKNKIWKIKNMSLSLLSQRNTRLLIHRDSDPWQRLLQA